MIVRKVGERKQDLSNESSAKVLKTAKTLIRTDFGGKDPDEQIQKFAAQEGVVWGPKSCAIAKKLCEKQVDGCRKRTTPRIDEIIKRLGSPNVVETAP
jgi:hypothetical protein